MRQERQTALKETAELRRELNGGAGPLEPARLAEIHAQLDAKMAAATRRKEEMLRQEKRRKREANAARLSAAAARVANQREEKHRKIAGKVAGKEARREDLKDRSRGNRANIARRFDRPTNPDDASRTDGAVGSRGVVRVCRAVESSRDVGAVAAGPVLEVLPPRLLPGHLPRDLAVFFLALVGDARGRGGEPRGVRLAFAPLLLTQHLLLAPRRGGHLRVELRVYLRETRGF